MFSACVFIKLKNINLVVILIQYHKVTNLQNNCFFVILPS